MDQRTSSDQANEPAGLTIGSNIRSRRQARGWKLQSLADRAGITVSYLSDVERDRTTPSLPVLQRIAEALGCTARELLRGVDPYDRAPDG